MTMPENTRVGVVLPWVSRAAGGLLGAVSGLARSLMTEQGVAVQVFGSADEFSAADEAHWRPVPVHTTRTLGPARLCYMPDLDGGLGAFDPDLVHSCAVWTFPAATINGWHARTGKPYIVSPHGTLDPGALRFSPGKKAVASLLYQRRHFERAACLHALCAAEAQAIRAYGLRNPVCVIPNGVDLPAVRAGEPRTARSAVLDGSLGSQVRGRNVMLYLGRIHPKKGLESLLRAWGAVCRLPSVARAASSWVLVVAGWDEAGHERQLLALAEAEGLHGSVVFAGPKFGQEKAALYGASEAFILPSLSEGLPMTVLEAWSHGLPVLMTDACNLPCGFSAAAALRVETDPSSMAQGLTACFRTAPAERRAMGARGYELVRDRFTWSRVAEAMHGVYTWVLRGGTPPACVSAE